MGDTSEVTDALRKTPKGMLKYEPMWLAEGDIDVRILSPIHWVRWGGGGGGGVRRSRRRLRN